MVLRNRSRVEILYDIIAAAKPFGKKTHLMYRGNLSYQQLDLYLNFILKNGLLEERIVEDSKLYFVTEKGTQFMSLFQDMHGLMVTKKEMSVTQQAAKERKSSVASDSEVQAPPLQTNEFMY